MKLTYQGSEAVIVPDAGLTVAPGQTVEVPDTIAASLALRPEWRKAKTTPKEA